GPEGWRHVALSAVCDHPKPSCGWRVLYALLCKRSLMEQGTAGEGAMRKCLAAAWAALILSTMADVAGAQEVTLKGITSFAEKTFYSRAFERFIEKVNEDGKGLIRINYVGGPKAMPPFEVGKALAGGVVDIANATGAFYTNVMPEADAWKLTE